jgi:hypothetical protein
MFWLIWHLIFFSWILINVISKPCFIQLLNRTIRVDHVADYKPPKDSDKLDEETRKLHAEGCAPLQTALPIKHEEGESVKNKMLIIWCTQHANVQKTFWI